MHALLAQYCRHITTARRLARLIEEMDAAADINVRDYGRLLKAQERESRTLASLATGMRISQQATSAPHGPELRRRYAEAKMDRLGEILDNLATKSATT